MESGAMGKSLTSLNVEPMHFHHGSLYFSVVYSPFSAGAYPETDQEDDDSKVAEDAGHDG